jgi:hypothetical protein
VVTMMRIWLLSILSAPCWTVVGLILSAIGVLLLFRCGMPYRIRSGGAVPVILEQTSTEDKRAEVWFDKLGWLGLVLLLLGTGFQIVGALVSPS